ncbi:MAG: ABC transporter ATP-binding protein [Chitinispirillaceae bacterium]|jgi:zinc transport system ATP-binding protein|nr:ABC transporter ATP-binding protein [Chitinispirillaceae bacterium]
MSKALELDHVSFSYGIEPAVRDVSFAIDEGDFLGIIGPNGGGKTTLLRLILGVLRPQSGSIKLLGGDPEKTRIRAGYVPQETSSNKGFPILVRDAVLMGLTSTRGIGRGFTRTDRTVAEALIEEFGLSPFANRQIGELSGGQRQKVLLCRALVANPRILFLDEPTASIDTARTDEIYMHLDRLNAHGTTVVIVTHNLNVVSKHIKSIACVNKELHFHADGKLDQATVDATYGCPVDLIAHGIPHRVYPAHGEHYHD